MSFVEGVEDVSTLSGVISAVSRDRNLDKAVIIDALEQALLHAARRDMGLEADLEVAYNEESDELELFSFRVVVENGKVPLEQHEVSMSEARKLDPEAELGDSLGIKVETSRFGRIATQSAKQIIVQKVRDAERARVYEEYKDRIGEVMTGQVVRLERNDVVVDLGRVEAVLPHREQMHSERFRAKDRIQAYVMDVKRSSRGPQVILSRAHAGFLKALFSQHVTEIYDGIVTIESAARDAGLRSKIAVYSRDSSVDPVGACVGMKGARVQAVVQELNGEKIDIVPWDPDPAKLVCNALAPAVVSKVVIDEDRHAMEVIVAEDQLSLAIGRRGQNVRLGAQLTGWRLDIKSEARLEEQMAGVKSILASIQGLGDMHAGILVHEGIKSPAELAEVSPRFLGRMLNLDEEEAESVIAAAAEKAADLQGDVVDTDEYRAEDAVAIPLQESEEKEDTEEAARRARVDMFLQLRGVGEAAAFALADAGYATIGDVIADSADEVAQKADLSLAVARTVQIAADHHLQEQGDE
ncbi:MAG: transcription termination factor NusA [Oligoflexales bacterium]